MDKFIINDFTSNDELIDRVNLYIEKIEEALALINSDKTKAYSLLVEIRKSLKFEIKIGKNIKLTTSKNMLVNYYNSLEVALIRSSFKNSRHKDGLESNLREIRHELEYLKCMLN